MLETFGFLETWESQLLNICSKRSGTIPLLSEGTGTMFALVGLMAANAPLFCHKIFYYFFFAFKNHIKNL